MLDGDDKTTKDMVEVMGIAALAAVEDAGNLVEIDADAIEFREELRFGLPAPPDHITAKRAATDKLCQGHAIRGCLQGQSGKLRIGNADRRELGTASLQGLFARTAHVLASFRFRIQGRMILGRGRAAIPRAPALRRFMLGYRGAAQGPLIKRFCIAKT